MHPIIQAPEPILRCQNILGEGCLWEIDKQLLHWIDIMKGEIWTLDPATGNITTVKYPVRIGTIALRKSHPGSYVLGAEKSIGFTDPTRPGEIDFLPSPISPRSEEEIAVKGIADRFNDGVCDKRGRLLTGTMGKDEGKPSGQFYSLDPDTKEIRMLKEDVYCFNGLGFSPSSDKMYFQDSGWPKESTGASIMAYDYNLDDGTFTNPTVVAAPPSDGFEDGTGTYDGLTMDEDGNIWTCRWRGSRIMKISPTGEVLFEIRFEKARNITCCVFGGKDRDVLYVTTASCEASGEPDLVSKFPEGGDLYAIHIPDTKGQEKYKFGG